MKASLEIFSLMLRLEHEEQKAASPGTRRHSTKEIAAFLVVDAPQFDMPDMKGTWLTKGTVQALYNTYLTGPVQEQKDGKNDLVSAIIRSLAKIEDRINNLEEKSNALA